MNECLPNSLHILLWNMRKTMALLFAWSPCGFELTMTVVNGLPRRILPKTSEKIFLDSCNWLALHIIQHTSSLLLFGGCYIAPNDFRQQTRAAYHFIKARIICPYSLSLDTNFLNVFTSFVKTLHDQAMQTRAQK